MRQLLYLFFFLSLGLIQPAFAQNHAPAIDPRDTFKLNKSEYKLNKKEFVERYARDDSSRALIDVFFNDRKLGFYLMPVYPVLIIGPGLFAKNYTPTQKYTGEFATEGGVAGIATLTGIYFVASSTRKSLLKELKFYKLNGYLSNDYNIRVKQKLFRKVKRAYRKAQKEKKAQKAANDGKAHS